MNQPSLLNTGAFSVNNLDGCLSSFNVFLSHSSQITDNVCLSSFSVFLSLSNLITDNFIFQETICTERDGWCVPDFTDVCRDTISEAVEKLFAKWHLLSCMDDNDCICLLCYMIVYVCCVMQYVLGSNIVCQVKDPFHAAYLSYGTSTHICVYPSALSVWCGPCHARHLYIPRVMWSISCPPPVRSQGDVDTITPATCAFQGWCGHYHAHQLYVPMVILLVLIIGCQLRSLGQLYFVNSSLLQI